jgi:hypothetical protein
LDVVAEHPLGSLDGFADFILAHEDTLEELDLGSLVFDRPELLKKDSLPKLKKFTGHHPIFRQMLDASLDCLHNLLGRLELSIPYDSP